AFFAIAFQGPEGFAVHAEQFWWQLGVAILGSALVLPLILLDVLRLSHRWVGPIFRLQSSLSDLSQGKAVPPIRFRQGDFWPKLAGDFNVIAAELNFRRQAAETPIDSETLEL